MKKHIIVSFIAVISIVFVFGQIGFTQDMKGRPGLGVRASYVNYAEDDYTTYGIKVDVEPNDAAMFGINFTYFFDKYISLELSADYTETDVEISALGLSDEVGELTQIPILLSGRIHFSTNPKVNPYLSLGVGYFFNDFDSDPNISGIDVDNDFGYHVGAGIEFFFSENTALNIDGKYIWTEVEAEDITGATEDFEINPFILGLGIKYYF